MKWRGLRLRPRPSLFAFVPASPPCIALEVAVAFAAPPAPPAPLPTLADILPKAEPVAARGPGGRRVSVRRAGVCSCGAALAAVEPMAPSPADRRRDRRRERRTAANQIGTGGCAGGRRSKLGHALRQQARRLFENAQLLVPGRNIAVAEFRMHDQTLLRPPGVERLIGHEALVTVQRRRAWPAMAELVTAASGREPSTLQEGTRQQP